MRLTEQAAGLDSLLTDSRHTSENAVAAATSYQNIAKAIDEGLQSAQGIDPDPWPMNRPAGQSDQF